MFPFGVVRCVSNTLTGGGGFGGGGGDCVIVLIDVERVCNVGM